MHIAYGFHFQAHASLTCFRLANTQSYWSKNILILFIKFPEKCIICEFRWCRLALLATWSYRAATLIFHLCMQWMGREVETRTVAALFRVIHMIIILGGKKWGSANADMFLSFRLLHHAWGSKILQIGLSALVKHMHKKIKATMAKERNLIELTAAYSHSALHTFNPNMCC